MANLFLVDGILNKINKMHLEHEEYINVTDSIQEGLNTYGVFLIFDIFLYCI